MLKDAEETKGISSGKLELVATMKVKLDNWMESVEKSGNGEDYVY